MMHGGNMNNIFGGGEFHKPPDDKRTILRKAMYSAQPVLSDFLGYPDFPENKILADQKYLNAKIGNIALGAQSSSDDDYARDMEPILTYILNTGVLLPSRTNFSFLASDYDDKFNGTDIVFGVQNKKTKDNMLFSVDVATGTLLKSIQSKFENSLDRHDGVSNIDYCIYKDQRWSETDTPHFILGMSPASQDKAFEKIRIENGELKGRDEDLDTDFIVLSEIKEQIEMQLSILVKKPRIESIENRIAKLSDLMPAIGSGLYRTLGINASDFSSKVERKKVFTEKYNQKANKLLPLDDVYKNIVYESNRREDLFKNNSR